MKSCPVCGVKMIRGGNQPQTRSKDHIVPSIWGGGGERWNIRFMCKLCNHLRAKAGHCLGALACARAIAETSDLKDAEVLLLLREWNFDQRPPFPVGGGQPAAVL